jgi:hypothetical protein
MDTKQRIDRKGAVQEASSGFYFLFLVGISPASGCHYLGDAEDHRLANTRATTGVNCPESKLKPEALKPGAAKDVTEDQVSRLV